MESNDTLKKVAEEVDSSSENYPGISWWRFVSLNYELFMLKEYSKCDILCN